MLKSTKQRFSELCELQTRITNLAVQLRNLKTAFQTLDLTEVNNELAIRDASRDLAQAEFSMTSLLLITVDFKSIAEKEYMESLLARAVDREIDLMRGK